MNRPDATPRTLADVSEDELLGQIFPSLPTSDRVLLGPGDDTAALSVASGAVLATTDAMVLGRDWLDEWSTGEDVGSKCVTQNVADIAAMGGVTTGLLITLVADVQTPLAWVTGFTDGLAAAAAEADVAVLGGDLSSAPEGVRMVSVTALGECPTSQTVRRSGARPGDVIAVAGSLGRSAAGLELLRRGLPGRDDDLVGYHRRPRTPYEQGPIAAGAGATAMLDISDGLLRDLGRIATASGVAAELHSALLEPSVDALVPSVGDAAWPCVLTGGEEHSLLATFPADRELPHGWRSIGQIASGEGVTLDGRAQRAGGWDHFAG